MTIFNFKRIHTDDLLIIKLTERGDKMDCQIYTIHEDFTTHVEPTTMSQIMVDIRNIRVANITIAGFESVESSIRVMQLNHRYTEETIDPEVVILLRFIDNAYCHPIPYHIVGRQQESIRIWEESRYLIKKLFNDEHTVEERITAMYENLPKFISDSCKFIADKYCEKFDFSPNDVEWESMSIRVALTYYFTNRVDLIYEKQTESGKGRSIVSQLIDQIDGESIVSMAPLEKTYYFRQYEKVMGTAVIVKSAGSAIECKVYMTHFSGYTIDRNLTFFELMDLCIKSVSGVIPTKTDVDFMNLLIARKDSELDYATSYISEDDLLTLDFLEYVSDIEKLPIEPELLMRMSINVSQKLFPGRTNIDELYEVVQQGIPQSTLKLMTRLTNVAFGGRGFKTYSTEWKAFYILVACQYHCGGWRKSIYSLGLQF